MSVRAAIWFRQNNTSSAGAGNCFVFVFADFDFSITCLERFEIDLEIPYSGWICPAKQAGGGVSRIICNCALES